MYDDEHLQSSKVIGRPKRLHHVNPASCTPHECREIIQTALGIREASGDVDGSGVS